MLSIGISFGAWNRSVDDRFVKVCLLLRKYIWTPFYTRVPRAKSVYGSTLYRPLLRSAAKRVDLATLLVNADYDEGVKARETTIDVPTGNKGE